MKNKAAKGNATKDFSVFFQKVPGPPSPTASAPGPCGRLPSLGVAPTAIPLSLLWQQGRSRVGDGSCLHAPRG